MRSKRMFRAGLATTAALALLAAACGDDGESADAPDDPAGDEPATVEVDEEPVEDEADEVEVDEAALQAILDEWRTEVDSYGATLSIRVSGHGDIHLASGVDDRDITTSGPDGSTIEHSETPMPTDGTYPIDVVTTTFVAATALQLVDEGRLSLDETVERWLPEVPNADQITLAMLLDHTSGLGSWIDAPDYIPTLVADPARSFTPEEVLTKHLEVPPTGAPGEGYGFTDAGYVAVGLLIERKLDQDLATVIDERISEPLSLNDTFLSDGSTKPTRHGWFALPDDPDPDRPLDFLDAPHEAAMTSLWAAGGMISSSEDLLDWAEALYSGDVLGEQPTAVMLEMRNPVSPTRHAGLGAGGYCLDDTGCTADEVDVFGNTGNNFGYRVFIGYHPDSGTTAVVHNSGVVPTFDSVPPLLAEVLDQLSSTDGAPGGS